MDVNKIMNIVVPPVTVIVLIFFLPFYLVFKFISYIKRTIFKEDVTGKVVLITGAASGIGEYLAYEYAQRGARLALVDIREDRLPAVAKTARSLGSPDVIVLRADVSKSEDCQRFVEDSANHFGQLDHLVNNAGITGADTLGDSTNLAHLFPTMDTNFWGSVYGTHFAIPHLRKSKGKIIVISSAAGRFPLPVSIIYNASKAALKSLYETLSVQLGSDIGITIVFPGFIKSGITQNQGFNPSMANLGIIQLESTEVCAKAIVNSACRGDAYLTVPSWINAVFLVKALCPEVFSWFLWHPTTLARKGD